MAGSGFDLERAVREAKPGAVVNVPAGNYGVTLLVDKPISLVAMGTVVLDGRQRGPVVRVTAEGLVRLGGLMIVGGSADEGGGVCQVAGRLELMQCTVRFNRAPLMGGGGVALRGREALLSQCRIEGNTGRQGAGVLADGAVEATLTDCALIQNAGVDGGGLAVREGARVEVRGCTIADNAAVGEAARGAALSVRGSTTKRPRLLLSHSIVSARRQLPETITNHPSVPGELLVERCLLPPWCASLGGDSLYAEPRYLGTGAEPYQLAKDSPALGAGRPGGLTAVGARDLLGHERAEPIDLGAFSARR